MNNKAAQAYIQTKVGTTDQGQLLLLLYDGALRFLQQAREKMLAKDYAGKGVYISKALDIIGELSSSLNMEKGGELATNLNNLYFLCIYRHARSPTGGRTDCPQSPGGSRSHTARAPCPHGFHTRGQTRREQSAGQHGLRQKRRSLRQSPDLRGGPDCRGSDGHPRSRAESGSGTDGRQLADAPRGQRLRQEFLKKKTADGCESHFHNGTAFFPNAGGKQKSPCRPAFRTLSPFRAACRAGGR